MLEDEAAAELQQEGEPLSGATGENIHEQPNPSQQFLSFDDNVDANATQIEAKGYNQMDFFTVENKMWAHVQDMLLPIMNSATQDRQKANELEFQIKKQASKLALIEGVLFQNGEDGKS